jgi:hypothetical protein
VAWLSAEVFFDFRCFSSWAWRLKKARCHWMVMYNMSAEIAVHYLSFKFNNYNILILSLKMLSILNDGVFNFNGNQYTLCCLKWYAAHLKFQNYSFSLQTTAVWDFWLNHIRKGADCKHSCRTMHLIHEFCSLQMQVPCTGTKEVDGRNVITAAESCI